MSLSARPPFLSVAVRGSGVCRTHRRKVRLGQSPANNTDLVHHGARSALSHLLVRPICSETGRPPLGRVPRPVVQRRRGHPLDRAPAASAGESWLAGEPVRTYGHRRRAGPGRGGPEQPVHQRLRPVAEQGAGPAGFDGLVQHRLPGGPGQPGFVGDQPGRPLQRRLRKKRGLDLCGPVRRGPMAGVGKLHLPFFFGRSKCRRWL